jgi:hypothetical protein
MENLAFDIHGIPRHDLTYTTLSRICTKENLYLFHAFQQKNCNVDAMVKEETNRFEASAKYKLPLLHLKTFGTSYLIIQSLNT